MTDERDDYMRRQEADHDLLRMRDPAYKPTISKQDGRYWVTGYPLTDRMKRFGITGMSQQGRGGGWEVSTAEGSDVMPHAVALWFMGRS